MANKKIPVALSKNDYAYLHYIQQGSIYSGKPIADALLIGDILKAAVFNCSLDFYFNWEKYGRNIMVKFLKADGKDSGNLPKTQGEFSMDIEKHIKNDDYKQFIETEPETTRIENNESLGSVGDNDAKKGVYGQPPIYEPGVSTFILGLDDKEMDIFEITKTVLEKYRGKQTSFSEMTRGFFRYLFVNVERADNRRNIERFTVLSAIYTGDLYGFTAVESVMLLHNLTKYFDVSISREHLAKLRLLYTDKPIYDFYKQEMEDISPKANEEESMAKDYNIENIPLNNSMSERFRSVNAHFSFHSAYLGYNLLYTEWLFEQHNLPLLACYLNSSNSVLGITTDAMEWFSGEMETLFGKSVAYNESPGTIIKPKKKS